MYAEVLDIALLQSSMRGCHIGGWGKYSFRNRNMLDTVAMSFMTASDRKIADASHSIESSGRPAKYGRVVIESIAEKQLTCLLG